MRPVPLRRSSRPGAVGQGIKTFTVLTDTDTVLTDTTVDEASHLASAAPRASPRRPTRRGNNAAAHRKQPRRTSRARVTFSLCLRYRITGLAAEAAFWILLSLPALALGTVGVLGYMHGELGEARAARLEQVLTNAAGTVLSQRAVRQTVAPALHDMLTSGHADVVSAGFLIALWSGSRALNVAIDTITVASGQNGLRGIVRTRLLAFGLYLPALLLGAATVPLLLAGTELLGEITPTVAAALGPLAWPLVAAAAVAFLTTLYHLALPHRRRWLDDVPGAFVALAMWAVGSTLLRLYLHSGGTGSSGANESAGGVVGAGGGGTAGFGIAATAAILLWLYITALAVLIGAVYNAVRATETNPASADSDAAASSATEAASDPRDSRDASAQVAIRSYARGESAGEKAVEPNGGPSDNISKTPSVPSPRMTRSSA